MQISFNGIKNITADYYRQDEKIGSYNLSMQLTNDENGNDLDEYRKLLKEHPDSYKLAHPYDDSFIYLAHTKDEDTGTYYQFTDINNSLWEIAAETDDQEHKINDKILPMFTFINKLTQKICNMPKKDFVYDEECNYIEKIVACLNPYLHNEVGEQFQTSEEEFAYIYNEEGMHGHPYSSYTDLEILNEITKIKDIKRCAKEINKGVHEQMCEYFDVQS